MACWGATSGRRPLGIPLGWVEAAAVSRAAQPAAAPVGSGRRERREWAALNGRPDGAVSGRRV